MITRTTHTLKTRKASCVGFSVTLIVENGVPLLGTWQGVYFCEFDGPRERQYHIKIIAE